MSRRFSLHILLPIEGYEEDKIYESKDISHKMMNQNKKPDDVYYRRLKEKSVYASFDDIVKFACQKYLLGEIHNFSMHTDYFGDCEIEYEGNKYIVTEGEVKQLEREHITESVYCNEFKYCSLSWFYTSIGDELIPEDSFDDKDLISFGLVNEQGDLTNAGALLADESPIRCSRLFCTRWNGLNKSGGAVDALDDAEYSGSVISLIENGEAFIKRNCKMKWRKTANSREEMPEYVERSYHEALVNALAHRDYLVNGSEVHIDIYDDRMEIYSPGGMPDGSMIQDRDPLTVPSTRRNPVLADVFNRLGYMERKGSGFGKIISGYEFQINYNESKRPSFRSDRYQFTVVMPNLNYDVSQDVPQDVPQGKLDAQIVDMIRKDSKISTEKIAIELGVSSKTIKRHIKEMDNVSFVGRGFSGHWEITDDE